MKIEEGRHTIDGSSHNKRTGGLLLKCKNTIIILHTNAHAVNKNCWLIQPKVLKSDSRLCLEENQTH